MERESMDYDVVIVGAGPAGLSAACRIKQINDSISVCVVEKGSEVGAHILSGAVLEPRALTELFPDWEKRGAPVDTAVSEDLIYLFSENSGTAIPGLLSPKTMHNKGNYIVSLGNLCRWLAEQAEQLGVEIFPGFAAAEVLYGDNEQVLGVITGDMGVSREGDQKDGFMPGMELRGKYTLFAEGCRGHLGKALITKFQLDKGKEAQHYSIGLKELWKIPSNNHKAGRVIHSAGWPLAQSNTAGGGFLYHLHDNLVSVGLVVDLGYSNPHVSPFDEFQRYKHHPIIAAQLEGGERISYGARAIVKGGIQAQPKMAFPGGILIGDDAGTLNFAKIKGSHTAMKSGMIAAECVAEALAHERANDEVETFTARYQASWAYKELYMQRNFGPAQHRWGNFWGSAYSFVDINLFNGKLPWTLSDPAPDYDSLLPADQAATIAYPRPDGKLSFDKLSSVFLSNTNHEEDQPCHLMLQDASIPIAQNLPKFDEPAQRYCPAGVYEVIRDEAGNAQFQINAQNCVHCKTCDIKDPAQNITWYVPEGGGGPNYPNM